MLRHVPVCTGTYWYVLLCTDDIACTNKYVPAYTCMYLYVLIYTCIQRVLVQQEFRWSKPFPLVRIHLRYMKPPPKASAAMFSMCQLLRCLGIVEYIPLMLLLYVLLHMIDMYQYVLIYPSLQYVLISFINILPCILLWYICVQGGTYCLVLLCTDLSRCIGF